MQTQDMQDEKDERAEVKKHDPLLVALKAINDFDRSQLPPGHEMHVNANGRDLYKRAMLRVAYAQAFELRRLRLMWDTVGASTGLDVTIRELHQEADQ